MNQNGNQNGKGSKPRPINKSKYDSNYDFIKFNSKKRTKRKNKK